MIATRQGSGREARPGDRSDLVPDREEVPEPVLVREFLERLTVVSPFAEGADQDRQARCVTDRGGHRRAVEIGSEPYPVDSDLLDEILDPGDDHRDRGVRVFVPVGPCRTDLETYSDEAVEVADRSKLAIGQVPRDRADRVRGEWLWTIGQTERRTSSGAAFHWIRRFCRLRATGNR